MCAERGGERHPPAPASIEFMPTHRHLNYSKHLHKPSAPSPSLLTTSSTAQASPAQTLAQTHTGWGQSAPCTTITFPPAPASQDKQHTLPGNPLGSPGWSSQSRLDSASWTFLVPPWGSQTEPAQVRIGGVGFCLFSRVLEAQGKLTPAS